LVFPTLASAASRRCCPTKINFQKPTQSGPCAGFSFLAGTVAVFKINTSLAYELTGFTCIDVEVNYLAFFCLSTDGSVPLI
jgi:hypothetical protein